MRTPVIRNPDYPKDLWTYLIIMHMHSSSHMLIVIKMAACSKSESETLRQKIEIIDRVKSETVSKLAAEYGIGNSTITDLKKKERSLVTTTECQSSHDRKKGDVSSE